ncbi:MAG: leucine-rich repeat protein, partial [Lachnospirales bacterium]
MKKSIIRMLGHIMAIVMAVSSIAYGNIAWASSDVTTEESLQEADDTIIYEGDFEFDLSTGTITCYMGSGTDVVIPSTINGVAVEAIDNYAFSSCKSITSVTIPKGVTFIGDFAFKD